MSQEILDEIQKLFDVVAHRLNSETPDAVSPDLPLYSNKLTDEQIEAIRSGLEARLGAVVSSFVPQVVIGRTQDENESGSLVVCFRPD